MQIWRMHVLISVKIKYIFLLLLIDMVEFV